MRVATALELCNVGNQAHGNPTTVEVEGPTTQCSDPRLNGAAVPQYFERRPGVVKESAGRLVHRPHECERQAEPEPCIFAPHVTLAPRREMVTAKMICTSVVGILGETRLARSRTAASRHVWWFQFADGNFHSPGGQPVGSHSLYAATQALPTTFHVAGNMSMGAERS